jgi:hypothetical protein
MNTRSLFLIFAVSCLFACNKEYLQWNLDKKKTPPEVTTVAVGEVFASSAFIEIQLDFNGNSEVTQLGVCFGLQNDPDINSNIALAEVSDSTQSVLISGLEPNTVYYARAFAQNIVGVSYGESLSFATLPVSAPTINTSQASNITLNSVQIGGSILSDGGSGITEKGICYSTTSNTPTIANSKVTASGNDASFTVTLSGLENTTTYYARAYATNNLGTSYGNMVTFTTASVPDVLVETNNCNTLNGISALFVSWQGSGYQSSPMCIANNGFIGSCINDCVSNPLGATIEFQRTFTQVGHIRFRSRAYDGNTIRVPTIYIDNSIIGATDLNAGSPANNWHLIKSDNIASGPHTIRIVWSQVSVYYDYSLDEIEFWE